MSTDQQFEGPRFVPGAFGRDEEQLPEERIARLRGKGISVETKGGSGYDDFDLLNETLGVLENFSDNFRIIFRRMCERDPHFQRHDPRGRVISFMDQTNMFRPGFDVMDYEAATHFLDKYDIFDPRAYYTQQITDVERYSHDLFVIFRLPKPLDAWWKKGEGDWGSMYNEVNNMNIEWGRYYREMMYPVWTFIEGRFTDTSFRVEGLSEIGQHVPGVYYYAWRFVRKPSWYYVDSESRPTTMAVAFFTAFSEAGLNLSEVIE